MAAALRRSSPALLKMRGLHNLNELLKAGASACRTLCMQMMLSR